MECMVTTRTVVYHRDVLYDEIWREPATEVAKRYSVSSVALGKICRALDVPTPPRGFWARHVAGNAPPRPELPPRASRSEVRVTRRTPNLDPVRVAESHAIGRLATGLPIVVPSSGLTRPHPLVAAAAKALVDAPLRNGVVHGAGDCIDVVVSPELLSRALRIMNALILALEERGLPVEIAKPAVPIRTAKYDEGTGGTRVLVGAEWIRFQLVEALEQHTPPMIKKAPKSLSGADLELWRHWNRQRMQLVPSGKLILRIRERTGRRTSWCDDRRLIEDKLNDFVKQLFVIADAKKQTQEGHDRWRAAHDEQQARAERQRVRAERRERRIAFVKEQLERWRDARDIRAMVAETRGTDAPGTHEPKWLSWASRYADEIDPARSFERLQIP